MGRTRIGLLLVLAMVGWANSSRGASPEEIDQALEKARQYLYAEQHQGNWENDPTPPTADRLKELGDSVNGAQWGGRSALATYALLAAGESAQNPKLAEAIKWVEKADLKGVYALGMRAQLLTLLPSTPENRHFADTQRDLFQHAIFTTGKAKGNYDYLYNSTRNFRTDHSISQYGVLGMWACERAGSEVPSGYWKLVESTWLADQDASGGWCYAKQATAEKGITSSMTAAGVATLFITQDYLHADNGVKCTGNVRSEPIEKGLAWLTNNFNSIFEDSHYGPYYTLYGLERIGVASGLKYFGDHNWFEKGADYLINDQRRNGSWPGALQNTAFAMLFLSRGKAPVVFNKLEYEINGKAATWNQRPRDVANFTRWFSRQTERDLNWQIANLKAPVRDLHDAPILYISGSEAQNFKTEELAKLKRYCEEGGMILGHADCGSSAFAGGFRKLGKQLFPQYEFAELAKDHPIFINQQYPSKNWKRHISVLSLDNDVRPLMILLPAGDPAKWWQLQEVGGHEEDYQLASDIFLFAVDKQNLQEKGKTYWVDADSKLTSTKTISVARLQYTGNWDPEPGGWRRLAAIMHNSNRVDLNVTAVDIGKGKLAGDIAHLTGTTKFTLDSPARDEIKRFVNGGGTLVVDAAGGSSDFASSAEAELTAMFGSIGEVLPATDAVYNLPTSRLVTFGYRPFARKNIGSEKGPRVRAIDINKRHAVFYSREDLSAGLVGESIDGIVGYDPATATTLISHLIRSAKLK